MGKRMTDTEKWKKPFIKSLPIDLKLFFLYILDDCDYAGVWQVDIEVAQIRLGISIDQDLAAEKFAQKIVVFDDGTKWFIPDFLTFQYGELSEKNKMYKPVMSILNKYNLMGHLSPIYGGKDKDKVKEKVKDKDKEKDKVQENGEEKNQIDHGSLLVPTMCDIWYKEFPHYTQDRVSDFPAMLRIAEFIGKQAAVPDITAPEVRDKLIGTLQMIMQSVSADNFWVNKPLKSISNNLQEFYNAIKNPKNGKKSDHKNGDQLRSDIQIEFSRRAEARRQNAGQ